MDAGTARARKLAGRTERKLEKAVAKKIRWKNKKTAAERELKSEKEYLEDKREELADLDDDDAKKYDEALAQAKGRDQTLTESQFREQAKLRAENADPTDADAKTVAEVSELADTVEKYTEDVVKAENNLERIEKIGEVVSGNVLSVRARKDIASSKFNRSTLDLYAKTKPGKLPQFVGGLARLKRGKHFRGLGVSAFRTGQSKRFYDQSVDLAFNTKKQIPRLPSVPIFRKR